MPHAHSNTKLYTRRIEDTIEQLLRRGQEINGNLEKEMIYARKQPHQRLSSVGCHHLSNHSTHSTVTRFCQPKNSHLECSSNLSTPVSITSSSREILTVSRRSCSSSNSSRVVDSETNIEMKVYSIEKENKKGQKENIFRNPSDRKVARKILSYNMKTNQQNKDWLNSPKVVNSSLIEEKAAMATARALPPSQEKKKVLQCDQKVIQCPQIFHQSHQKEEEDMKKAVDISSQSSQFQSKKEGWKQILSHVCQNLLKCGSDIIPCQVKTIVFQPNDTMNQWIRVNEIWTSHEGKQLLNLWTDLQGEKTKNVWVNGQMLKM